jgi:hypothetical protein
MPEVPTRLTTRPPHLANSYAPMSGLLRGTPRWSAGVTPLPPALIAGLPASRACVRVGPPLFASGPSNGLTLVLSLPRGAKPQPVRSAIRLFPCEIGLPLQSGDAPTPGAEKSLLPAMIVFLRLIVPWPPGLHHRPPFPSVSAVLPVIRDVVQICLPLGPWS